METQRLVTTRTFSRHAWQKNLTIACSLPFLVFAAPALLAQAVYTLDQDGALTQIGRPDATVSKGYLNQPVFYALGDDGVLTGSDQPRSVPQQPGARVALATSAGRRLQVTGRIVNVRKAPGLSAAITTQLPRGAQVISLEHDGLWVRVAQSGSERPLGWMYEPLLDEVFGFAAAPRNTPLARFRRSLERLKEGEETRGYYSGLESPELAGRASLSLVASEAWLEGRADDRWETITHLGREWRSLAPAAEMAILDVKDRQGRRQMTVIRP